MAEMKARILVADDEKDIRDILKLLLESEGYEVILASNGKEVLEKASEDINLYILDVDMPECNGFMAGAEIYRKYQASIIFLTAYSGESDKVMGFSVGCDDYITKPFSNMELLMRVKAVLRRSQRMVKNDTVNDKVNDKDRNSVSDNQNKIVLGDIQIDLEKQQVTKNGQTIVLTYTEYKILELFVTHQKKIYSLDNIYESIWGEAVEDATIMTHIKNLRKKLGDNSRNPKYIKTAWGRGYYVD